ncbi:hypothetical protein K9U39_08460 [Rhodoblastus acidophilus]|nr:hypothetical protein [Rhodoblastus acidophilus]
MKVAFLQAELARRLIWRIAGAATPRIIQRNDEAGARREGALKEQRHVGPNES